MISLKSDAARLGIAYRQVSLHCGGAKQWSLERGDSWDSVERSALSIYVNEGWAGCDGEGGLMLSLIKAASFTALPTELHSIFVESLYYHARYCDPEGREHKVDPADFLENVRSTTADKITANFLIMAGSKDSTPIYFKSVTYEKLLGLFAALGSERLYAIAEKFAKAPYELRAGWPDLTLWRGSEVMFAEIKAPGDRLHANQVRLITTILKPLDFNVSLVEVHLLA